MAIFNQKVTVVDIGKDYLLSNRGFLRVLQEAANLASNEVGHGISDIESTGTTWVLLYWRLNVLKRVEYNSTLCIKTWTNFTSKIYSIRYFEVYCNDELIAKADSKWVYVDSVKHSIQKIPEDLINLYNPIEDKLFESEYNEKLKLPDNLPEAYSYKIMKRDLDANHHVNNISFLDIGLEALPDNIKIDDYNNLYITFKKEMNYKDNISCYYEFKENRHIVYLYNNTTNVLSGTIIIE